MTMAPRNVLDRLAKRSSLGLPSSSPPESSQKGAEDDRPAAGDSSTASTARRLERMRSLLYDEHVAPGEADLATAGLRLAGLQAGDTFLDVAAGPAASSLPAPHGSARRCWPPTGPRR